MSISFDKFQKRRLITSYFSAILSIFLVLFLLGLLSLFVINSKKISNDFKEDIVMSVYFKDEANDSIIADFSKQLQLTPSIRSSKFVSKETAAAQHKDIIGEDFMEFLGFNPLQNSYDIHLKATYVTANNLAKIDQNFRSNEAISDVVYDKQLVKLVNNNIKKISFWILIISSFLTIVAFLLINSALRLSIYSNRFIIKTMQMVGATKGFIRKPFVWRSIKLGMIGAGLAVVALAATIFYLNTIFPGLGLLQDPLTIALVFLAMITIGILITWVSTFFATQRLLNLQTDDLY